MNKYIPHTPFRQQEDFLVNESEELLYGGQAGGGKSDALLMSALQYVNFEDYSALLLRRTYKDLALPNAIMNRCHKWLSPFVDSNEVKWDRETKTYTFPSGATLTFGYLAHDNDLDQYQGSELQFVGFDELTQFTERQYTYLHSRLRKHKNSEIPIRMRAGTNPGGRGHDWVKKRFILNNDNLFIPSAYTDNPYLDQDAYGVQLDKLDELTKRQLKYGDWDAVITEGLLCNRNDLTQNLVSSEYFKDLQPSYAVIGVDMASTGTDKFAMALLVYFSDINKIILVDLDVDDTSSPEQTLINFILRNKKWKPAVINFEREPGSASNYALNYWNNTLFDLSVELGFYIVDTPAVTTGNKYNRARPHAQLVKNGLLLFNKDIRSKFINGEIYNPLCSLFNQYVYVHPNLEIMKQYSSPDELDSVGFGFAELQKVVYDI